MTTPHSDDRDEHAPDNGTEPVPGEGGQPETTPPEHIAAEPIGEDAAEVGENVTEQGTHPSADPVHPSPAAAAPAPVTPGADTSAPAAPAAPGSYSPPTAGTPSATSSWETEASGAHRQERPVPRAGLSETHSAAHLTGQQAGGPAESSWQPHAEQATQPVPAGASPSSPAPQPPTQQMASGPYDTGQQPAVHAPPQHTAAHDAAQPIAQSGDQPEHQAADWSPRTDPYEDVPPARSRALAHVLSLLLTLVLAPVTMLCVAAVQQRLATQHQRLLAEGGSYTFGILAALLGALLLVAVLALLARWSSLGAIVVGALTLGLGLAAVVAPALQTASWMRATIDALDRFLSSLELGQTTLHLLATGQLALYGLALLLVGLVSHSARRTGREEGRAALQREHAAR